MKPVAVVVAIVAVVLSPGVAARAGAKDPPEAARLRALLERQAAAIDDGAAFAATCAPDALVLFPATEAVAADAAAIRAAVDDEWSGTAYGVTARLAAVKIGVAAGGGAAWATADLQVVHLGDPDPVSVARLRLTALAVKDAAGDDWHVVAEHISRPMPNAEANKVAPMAGELQMPALPGSDPPAEVLEGWFADPALLAQRVAKGPAVVLLGSDAKEKAVGSAAAGKLAGAWKAARFTPGQPTRAWTDPSGSVGWAAANVRVTFRVNKKELTVPYRALFFLVKDPSGWRWVSGHFATAY